MKLSIIILLLAFSISFSTSQSINKIGMKGGVTYSSWSYTSQDRLELGSRRGIDVGIFIDWSGKWNFSLVNEIHYVQKGVSGIIRNQQDVSRFSHLEYFSLTLLAKYRITSNTFSPYLLGGPRIDNLLSSDDDLRQSYLNYDAGVIMGLGVEFHSNIGFEFRYNYGLSNIYSTPVENVQNRSLEIILSVAP